MDTESNVTAENFTLSVTERAAQRVQYVIQQNDLPGTAGLRAGAVEGGCSGLNYDVKIEMQPEAGDLVIERHGARIFVSEFSLPYISGMTIDWIESMQESRFTFDNPNATGNCGCGVSFSV